MDNDERKQASSRDPYTQLEQIHSDFVLAMALQEQERAFTILTAIESDSNEEESDEDSSSESNADDNDYEFFQSREFESEMEFLQQEGQDSNSDEDMEEDGDEFDSDELSYEDLIALGEFVGQERAFTILTAIESDSKEEESDEDSSSESNADDNDYEFFQSLEFESEMEFLQQEGQDSNSDEDMEEDGDEVDSDELSYEDLIALGEFVGQERIGLSINEISTCLRPCKYESSARKTGTDRCVICQMEYEEDESLVALSCDHPYHSECIVLEIVRLIEDLVAAHVLQSLFLQ